MKNLIILIFCLLSYNSIASTFEVDVLSADYMVEDHLGNKSLCLTVVRLPESGEVLGVVEDIEDCFYARKANKSLDHKIKLNLNDLREFEVSALVEYLQTFDTQIKFLFSDGE